MGRKVGFGQYRLENGRGGFIKWGLWGILILVMVVGWLKLAVGSSWGDDRYYLMVVVEEKMLRVAGVNAKEGRLVELIIPDNMMIPVVGMSGSLKAGSLWQFAEGEGRAVGIVQSSLERWLGVKINGVIRSKSLNRVGWKEVLLTTDRQILIDKIRWFRVLNKLRDDQKSRMVVPDEMLERKRYPDGEEVLIVDESRFGDWVGKLWNNAGLTNEEVKIKVINATGEEGIGRLAERMIRGAGGLVVKVESGERQVGGCWFVAEGAENQKETKDWLTKQMDCEVRKEGDKVSMGEMELWLGEDWAKIYR